MFYSQDILQKRGGRFGKIWLAATKMAKLTRREIASINVEESCDDILAYVELRVAPAYQGARRPRFSLYLSALLMYGVVRIHQKHIEYLLNDVSTIFLRVKATPIQAATDIDLRDTPKADFVTMSNLLTGGLQQEQDLYLSQLDLETLTAAHTADYWGLNGSTPGQQESSTDVSVPKKRKRHLRDVASPLVANVDEITLKEPPQLIVDTPLSPIQVPKDMELPLMDGQELEMLMGDVEEPRLQVQDLLPPSTPISTDTRQRLGSHTSLRESPSRIQEDKEKTPARGAAPEIPEIPETRAVPPSPGVTQIITDTLPRRHLPRKSLELELSPTPTNPARRRRKRQLAFADAETQIPKNKMKQNMTTGLETCETFVLPDVKGSGATDSLLVPGRTELRREPWLQLWARNARFRRNVPDKELAEAISPPHQLSVLPELLALDQFQNEPPEAGRMPDVEVSTLQQPGDELPSMQQPGDELPSMQQPGDELPSMPQPGDELLSMPQPALTPVLPPQPERRQKKTKPSSLEESIEEMRKLSASIAGTPARELSSIEVQRDASVTSFEERRAAGLDESLILDDSRQSGKTRISTRKRRTRSSASVGEQQGDVTVQEVPSATSLHTSHTSAARTLYDVVEEQFIAVPLIQEIGEDQGKVQQELLRSIEDDVEHQSGQYTTFCKICPPQFFDRKGAVKMFTALLELCAQGSVIAKQEKSYEDIYLRLQE